MAESSGRVRSENRNKKYGAASGGVYSLAFLGALIYYLQHASTFGVGIIGILKAIVWPAFLIYSIMDYLKM
jgi:hypothetical protein